MADVVIVTHIPTGSGISSHNLKIALETLVRAIHPNIEIVAFAKGTDNPEGINAIQIKTVLNKATKDQLEFILKKLFSQSFEISYNSDNSMLNRSQQLQAAAIELYRLFNSSGTPALTP